MKSNNCGDLGFSKICGVTNPRSKRTPSQTARLKALSKDREMGPIVAKLKEMNFSMSQILEFVTQYTNGASRERLYELEYRFKKENKEVNRVR